MERPRRVDVADAAGVQLVVGRLHHDDEARRRAARARAAASARSRSTAAPRAGRTARRTARRASTSSIITAQRALHVARAEPVDAVRVASGPGGCPAPGRCRGGRRAARAAASPRVREHAGIAQIHDLRAAVAQHGRDVRGERRLRARLRRDVDQLERPRGEARSELGLAGRGGDGHARDSRMDGLGTLSKRPHSPIPLRPAARAGRAKQRAFCIAATPENEDLEELKELLRTAGVATVGELAQKLDKPHPNHYLGSGQGRRAQAAAQGGRREPRRRRRRADARASSATSRPQLDMPVLDRTAVILDIFAGHAHTAEGKMQVELAQLEYNMARMRGLWTHLERLGAGRGVGGIGTRGPGESQIETDRRLARDRITVLRRRLDAGQVHARRPSAPSASARTCRPSRSRATRTPASRRCSTRSPAPRSASATGSSTRWTRRPARCGCTAARS